MHRRLFFLLPDMEHARQVEDELTAQGINRKDIHLFDKKSDQVPPAVKNTALETRVTLDRIFWTGNLLLFTSALAGVITLLVFGLLLWALIPLAIVIFTLTAGFMYAVNVPYTNLSAFSVALRHGEVVLMVDTPFQQTAEIEHLVHARHPEAIDGGSSWTMSMVH